MLQITDRLQRPSSLHSACRPTSQCTREPRHEHAEVLFRSAEVLLPHSGLCDSPGSLRVRILWCKLCCALICMDLAEPIAPHSRFQCAQAFPHAVHRCRITLLPKRRLHQNASSPWTSSTESGWMWGLVWCCWS